MASTSRETKFSSQVSDFMQDLQVILGTIYRLLKFLWEELFNPIDKREVLAWIRKHVPGASSAFSEDWRDGVFLCTLLDSLLPGCFTTYDHDDDPTLKIESACRVLEQKFGISNHIVSTEEILNGDLFLDRKMLLLLSEIKLKSESILKDQSSQFKTKADVIETHPEVQSCFAKGNGLLVAFVGRKTKFNVFCDTSTDLDIVIEIRGPDNLSCGERITNRSPRRKPSACRMLQRPRITQSVSVNDALLQEKERVKLNDKIHLEYELQSDRIVVGYIPVVAAQYKITVLWHGQHVQGSPYTVCVEDAFKKLNDPNMLRLKPSLRIKNDVRSSDEEQKHSTKSTKHAVRFKDTENHKQWGKVIKRKVLRYIVKLADTEIAVEADSSDMLASALLKLDYQLENSSYGCRRNSWGFVGDVERKKSVVRQFCIDLEDIDGYGLQRRASSFHLSSNDDQKKLLNADKSNKFSSKGFLKTLAQKRKEFFLKSQQNKTDGLNWHLEGTEPTLECAKDSVAQWDVDECTETEGKGVSLNCKEEYFNNSCTQKFPDSQSTKSDDSNTTLDAESAGNVTGLKKSKNCESTSGSNDDSMYIQQNTSEIENSGESCVPENFESSYGERQRSSPSTIYKTCTMQTIQNNQRKKKFKKCVINKHRRSSHLRSHPFQKEYKSNKTSVKYVSRKTKTENIFCRTSPFSNKNVYILAGAFDSIKDTLYDIKKYVDGGLKNNCSSSSSQTNMTHSNVTCDVKSMTETEKRNLKVFAINNPLKKDNSAFRQATKEYLSLKAKAGSDNVQSSFKKEIVDGSHGISRNISRHLSLENCSHDKYSHSRKTNKRFEDIVPADHASHITINSFDHSEPNRRFEENLEVNSTSVLSLNQSVRDIVQDFERQSTRANYCPTTENFYSRSLNFPPLALDNERTRVKSRIRQWETTSSLPSTPYKSNGSFKSCSDQEKLSLLAIVQTKRSFWEIHHKEQCSSSAQPEEAQMMSTRKENQTKSACCLNLFQEQTLNDIGDYFSRQRPDYSDLELHNRMIPLPLASLTTSDDDFSIKTVPTSKNEQFEEGRSCDIDNFHRRSYSEPELWSPTKYSTSDLHKVLFSTSSLAPLSLSANNSCTALLSNEEYLADEYIDDEIPDYAAMFLDGYSSSPALLFETKQSMLKSNVEVCRVFGGGIHFGHVALKNHFQVLTRDAGRGNLSVSIQGPSHHEVANVNVIYTRKGMYDVFYKVTEPGYYLIAVRWLETPIPGSPFVCKITY